MPDAQETKSGMAQRIEQLAARNSNSLGARKPRTQLLGSRKLKLHDVPVIALDRLCAASNQLLSDDLRERCPLVVGALGA
jgi:hypothetical protein